MMSRAGSSPDATLASEGRSIAEEAFRWNASAAAATDVGCVERRFLRPDSVSVENSGGAGIAIPAPVRLRQ